MGVPRLIAEPVLDHDQVAVAARVPARERDAAHARRADRRAVGRGEVDAVVAAAAWVAETVADPAGDRPQEPHRTARTARRDAPAAVVAKRPQRAVPRVAVDVDAGRGLEALQRVERG